MADQWLIEAGRGGGERGDFGLAILDFGLVVKRDG
jgi:hypothetical protein